ncbi:hypothetical protein [Streptomyces sp. RK76]|uniref:hypothetical protein n=1 Tax=Streptomyces sp. RK76 TaxID=2824896 RepID=UPI001B35CF08|nr:hypothetical protein [Streptomyces sp. RK76]MBQ0954229.1 hypothetical protein [Streptomyces sp. RK76]
MSYSVLDSFRDAAHELTPSAVSQFLAAHDWELEIQQPQIKEIWRHSNVGDGRPARVMLPLATDYVDFEARFRDALEALGHIHAWDGDELRDRITGTRADLFFVRLDQPMVDGTIPFQQAEATLQSLLKMLKAAATTAADPWHSHRGRRPAGVSDFLQEDVRLGHTKRGSFIFTVVTRLGDARPGLETAGPELGESAVAFPRRVMETLARGLETTQRLTRQWDASVLEAPGRNGLSAALVESVEEMAQPAQLRSLDLSFEWAAAEAPPDVGLATIVLDRDVMAELPRVRERLIRREEPPQRVMVVGLVKGLAREEGQGEDDESADVTLLADVRGKMRSVHVSLTGEDHDWAIAAYQQKLPFTVTGDLVFERRAWRLAGDVAVDSSFLRHRIGPASPGGPVQSDERAADQEPQGG